MWAHSYLAMTHLNAEGDERIKQDHLWHLVINGRAMHGF
jgi:hypothetical protein